MTRLSQASSGEPSARPSRRVVLSALAAGMGAAGLGRVLTPRDGEAQAAGGEFRGAWPFLVPPAGHYNTFVTDGSALPPGLYADLVEMPLAMYYWHDQRWLWLLATGARFDGSHYVLSLRTGVRWSDGSAFGAQDVLDTWTILQALGNPLFDYVDTISAPDAHTVAFHMKLPSILVETYILHPDPLSVGLSVGGVRARAVYGGWAQRFRALLSAGKTATSPAVQALMAKFQLFRPARMVASGPFQVDPHSITEQQLTLVRNPTSWANAAVRFDRIVLYGGRDSTGATPRILAGQVDYATHAFPPAALQVFQQRGFTVLRSPLHAGGAIVPNYARVPALRAKEARQALLHAVRRDRTAAAAEGMAGVGVMYVAGLGDQLLPNWLDRATMARLNPYPYDPARATNLLESIGWRKGADGRWRTANGARAMWELLTTTEVGDATAAALDFAAQMAAFGIDITVRRMTFTQVPDLLDGGHFELAMGGWGGMGVSVGAHAHPYFSYQQAILYYVPPSTRGPGSGFELVQRTEGFGTVDLRKLVAEAGLGLDVARQRTAVRTLALVFNDLLPILPLWERYAAQPIRPGVQVAGWPAPGDPLYINNEYTDSYVMIMLLTGRLHPAP